MKIGIGSDHVGYALKMHIRSYLEQKGYDLIDYGAENDARSDYPVYGEKVARGIAAGECSLGILICGTGIGISIAANKIRGIRAAACSEPYSAALTRRHNDAQIIAFGARVVGPGTAEMIVDSFLEAAFEGERHQKRVELISEIEGKEDL
jgi:ribose 5-phosphate isomerase B